MKRFLKKLHSKIQKRNNFYFGAKQIRKHGIWYIDIPRTSSTSLKAELGILYGPPFGKAKLINKQKWADKLPRDYIASVKHRSDQIFSDHLPAIEMQKIIGEKAWDRIFSFTFVRNPWDRIVSLYLALAKALVIPDDMTFRDYVFALKEAQIKKEKSMLRLREYYYGSSDYVIDDKGNILVKVIGKYENRVDDIKKIAQQIGYEKFGSINITFGNPRNTHYSKYYDQETQNMIAEIYRKDIELFDYKFES